MRAASTLIPARFIALVGHLFVLVTLLWLCPLNGEPCLTKEMANGMVTYVSQLPKGFIISLTSVTLHLITFISGFTMFSYTLALISIACHTIGTLVLMNFVLDICMYDWFWIVYTLCSFVPALMDLAVLIKFALAL